MVLQYKSAEDKVKREKLKNTLVSEMLPVVRKIARTIARRDYDPVEDLVQVGSIALVKAIDGFSSERGTSFKIYAGCLIIGAMRHYIRDKSQAIKVPRHVWELLVRINSFISTLTPDELEGLTSSDVAEALNVPSTAVDFAMQADRRTSVISLEEIAPKQSTNMSFEDVIPAADYAQDEENKDTKIILTDVIAHLSDEYKEIVELYYYNDYNQKAIAKTLGITEMMVSRRLKRAFEHMYQMLSDSEYKRSKWD
jgi:RNA polymerase sigma-B factor